MDVAFQLLTGLGLSVSAGLNAYIPLLALGLAGRLLPGFALPNGWDWLADDWVMVIIAALLVIEFIADKVPVVDSINDVLQTVIRPAAGGIAFGTGSAATTAVVQDPAAFFASNAWVPVVAGAAIALAMHLAKAAIRPIVNGITAGIAAPVVSLLEDLGAALMTVFAILLPLLVLLGVAAIVWGIIAVRRRAKRRAAASSAH